jgi:hypothetical protein
MALKVINAGLGRTGTTSLKAALDRLGFGPGYHMFDIISNEDRLAQWEKIVCEGEPADWPAIYDGYTAAIDGPSAIYYQQLITAFPDAKVILTVRDAERWYESTANTLYQFAVNSGPTRLYRVVSTMIWDGLFDGRFADKAHAIEIYRQHNEEVIARVPGDNLLVYNVTEGWAPLCGFLDVPVPAGPFPRLNDSESMRARIGQLVT